jgi:ribose transport system ATP-binding protein
MTRAVSIAVPALRFTGVSKSFGGTRALHQVSFDIAAGSVHALCGGNGSGKSTLLKILAGVYQGDSGSVEVHGEAHQAARSSPGWARECGLHFVHQAVGTFPDLSVAENFALGSGYEASLLQRVPWRRLQSRVQEVLDRFELDVHASTKMAQLRPATQTMVAVARALQHEKEPGRDVLVLDEPTASLPAHEAEAVLDAIRGYSDRGQTVIFVTHRLPEILDVATDVTFLRDGNHLDTRPIEGLGERDLIERIAGHAVVSSPSNGPSAGRPTRLELKEYSAGPLRDLSLNVGAGEIVGISGLLGSGRTTLLQSLFGARPVNGGEARLDGRRHQPRSPRTAIRAGVAYLPEDRQVDGVFSELGVRENLSAPALDRYWNRIRLNRRTEAANARQAIARYGVVASSCEAPMSSMSGGNQQKVLLARWLELAPRLLLLDEPTQGVDVGARAAIHGLIKDAAVRDMSVLVVSSDPEELVDLCDRVVGIWQGGVSGEVTGADLTIQRCIELAYGLEVGLEPDVPADALAGDANEDKEVVA